MGSHDSKISLVQSLNTEVSKNAPWQRVGESERDSGGRVESSGYPEFVLLLKERRHGMRRKHEIIAVVGITRHDKTIET